MKKSPLMILASICFFLSKNKLNIFILSFLFIGLTSCDKLKIVKAHGSIDQETFTTSFPFELRQGVIVVEVTLKGNNYEFILDTGGFNLIDKKIADELGIKGKKTINIGDANNNKQEVPILKLDRLEIAGIGFLGTGTGIVNFEELNKVSCLELQGMIGANLMQNAVWEIDYQQQLITISNSITAFDIPIASKRVPFETDILVSPKVEVSVNGQLEKGVEIDLGSTGGFKLAEATYEKLTSPKMVTGNGIFSAGLYGYGNPENKTFARIDNLSFGEIDLINQVVTFKSSGTSTIGNDFLKDYRVIFNWMDKELTLIPVVTPTAATLENYGFKPIYKDGKLVIGFIYNDTSAKAGLKETDQIIALNNIPTENITQAEWCTILEEFKQIKDAIISVTVWRDGQSKVVELERKKLL